MTSLPKGLDFQVFFEAAAEGMLLVDDAGHVIQANTTARQLFGYSGEEIDGLEVEKLIPARYRDMHRHFREAYTAKPEKRPMGKGKNLMALTRGNVEIQLGIGLSPIQAEGKQYVLITCYTADRRQQAEDALRASEERLRLAKRAGGLGVFDFDARYNIIQCESNMCRIWGVPAGQPMTYEQFLAAIHPDDRPARQAAINHATSPESNGEYRVEYRVKNLVDGSQRWVATMGKVLFEDGHATRLVGIVQDITERKLLEQRVQQQRVEMETIAKQQVAVQTATAIAHELNQPLAAISAYSEVALHSLKRGNIDLEKLGRALEGCVTQAQRAGNSLHELMAFLQKSEVVSEPIDLNELVKEAIHVAQSDGYGGFHPILQLEHNLPRAMGNRTQVQKVLVNLLRNGVDAMRGAGVPMASITIRVCTRADLSMVQVTVQDKGPGVDQDTAKRIFEPFFTTKTTGIGMGLAVSRALIEANGGQLWLEPEAETGSTFHFTLPCATS